ncbi:MAG: GNAT family N-acetyltransferase [Phycisphaera sp.]|nr:GNAT family N-acetyltransferase [Phycisphaera sp.]
MFIKECDNAHSAAILAILNEVIATSTALYDYQPRTMEMMAAWFDAKRRGNYPVIGVFDDDSTLMGFASFGPFRGFPAYKYTVENSLYVAGQFRGRGLGRLLLEQTLERARAQGYHVVIAVIDSKNSVSIALHERCGFERTGLLPQVGFKFGKWLDVALYQRVLETPTDPVDG